MQQDQNSSVLLLIPPEVRNSIYELVFGGRIIGFACSNEESQKCHSLIEAHELPSLYHYSNEDYANCTLPLLLACRQIYFEARLFISVQIRSHVTAGSMLKLVFIWIYRMPAQTQAIESFHC